MSSQVHLLHTDGTVTCLGVLLEEAARPQHRAPLRLTIHVEETTCLRCLRRARELPQAA